MVCPEVSLMSAIHNMAGNTGPIMMSLKDVVMYEDVLLVGWIIDALVSPWCQISDGTFLSRTISMHFTIRSETRICLNLDNVEMGFLCSITDRLVMEQKIIMTSWHSTLSPQLAICEGNPTVTGALPSYRTSDAALGYFLFYYSEQNVDRTIEMSAIQDDLTVLWRRCNVELGVTQTPKHIEDVMTMETVCTSWSLCEWNLPLEKQSNRRWIETQWCSCDVTVMTTNSLDLILLSGVPDFEWRWSVPLFKCLTVLEFSFILFDLCLLITFFNFIMNYVPIVTFWIFTYHKIWILSIMFCFIWSYWIIYFLACLEVSWRVVS